MSLRVYNSLSQKKELFDPVRPGKVSVYVCGPTVYKPPHIGHMVGPVIFDAIKRYLVYKGFEVTWIVNITDVDDKIINEAKEKGLSPQQVAEKCTEPYLECLRMLGIDTIDRFPKASEHIGEMIQIIKKLIERGHAYIAGGSVWFDVASDADYGKLAHRTVEAQEAGTRDLEGDGKRNPADFALWKGAKKDEISWESPWGAGRPGWHIECSAMSMKYLGETIDIHGGGDDLKFPHHENELAQSECCTGKPFAKYWLHNGLTRVKTKLAGRDVFEKSSKSLGNVIDARQFIDEQGADLLRYLLLSTHYRSPIDFSDEVVAATRKGLAVFPRLFERIEKLASEKPGPGEGTQDMDQLAASIMDSELAPFARAVLGYKMKFLESMDDDFNTASAIAAMHGLAGEINSMLEARQSEQRQPEIIAAAKAAGTTLRKLGLLLGLFQKNVAMPRAAGRDDLSEKLMQILIGLRDQARKEKNFALSDAIRKGLTGVGVVLEDRPDGTGWRRE